MAEQQQQQATDAATKKGKGLSSTQILAVVTLVPIGGILLTLSGLTLTGSLIGMALATPVFVIFSPVLVPAVMVLMIAMTGFLTSGAIGLTALSSLRGVRPDYTATKRGMQEQRIKELGQGIHGKVGYEGIRT